MHKRTTYSVVTWPRYMMPVRAPPLDELCGGIVSVATCGSACAALLESGRVITWGHVGCEVGEAADELSSGVFSIAATEAAFFAFKEGGRLITWGQDIPFMTPKVSLHDLFATVAKQLNRGVVSVASGLSAFAALKDNGSVVTWPTSDGLRSLQDAPSEDQARCQGPTAAEMGGDSCSVAAKLDGDVRALEATSTAFAALKTSGEVITWGAPHLDIGSAQVAEQVASEVVSLSSTANAFAALKSNGQVITWPANHKICAESGGDSSAVSSQLSRGVKTVAATRFAFAAVKEDGSVVTWGRSNSGGDSSKVSKSLSGGVVSVAGTEDAFAAVKETGQVIVWGSEANGGKLRRETTAQLVTGVKAISSNRHAFAALKEGGAVVTWGGKQWGGDSSEVAEQLSSKIISVAGNQTGAVFVALREVDSDEPACKKPRSKPATDDQCISKVQKKPAAKSK